jgi:hypothetical protein
MPLWSVVHTVLCMSRVFLVSPVILLSSLCRSEKVNYSQADYLHIRATEKHVSLWGLEGIRNNLIFVTNKMRDIQKQAVGRGGVLSCIGILVQNGHWLFRENLTLFDLAKNSNQNFLDLVLNSQASTHRTITP